MQYVRDLFSLGKGVLRQAADRAFAPGQWAALPTADIDFRGALARTEGSTGVNDALRFAEKDTADAYRWALVPTLPTDPGADRIAFWDESDNAFRYLTASTGLTLSGTSLTTTAGMTLIGTPTTFSGAASATVDGVFSSTYTNYRLVISGLSASASLTLRMQLRVGGVTASAGDYYFGGHRTNQADVSATLAAAAAAFWNILSSAAAPTGGTISLDLSSPAVAVATNFSCVAGWHSSGATAIGSYMGGSHQVTTAYDGFILSGASGTITGTVAVYGYTR